MDNILKKLEEHLGVRAVLRTRTPESSLPRVADFGCPPGILYYGTESTYYKYVSCVLTTKIVWRADGTVTEQSVCTAYSEDTQNKCWYCPRTKVRGTYEEVLQSIIDYKPETVRE